MSRNTRRDRILGGCLYPEDWRLELERRGYGRYDEDYIKEAIERLADKRGPRVRCANCGDEIMKGRSPRYGCPSIAGEFVSEVQEGRLTS